LRHLWEIKEAEVAGKITGTQSTIQFLRTVVNACIRDQFSEAVIDALAQDPGFAKGYHVTGSDSALNVYIHSLESSLTIDEDLADVIGLYFLFLPTLTLETPLSSFPNLVTLDAGLWDKSKVSLDDIKTRAHPTTGKLRNFVAPDNLETISTDYQFGNLNNTSITNFTSFTAKGLKSIAGFGTFRYATIDLLNLPSLTTITNTSNYDGTFYYLNTKGNPLSLPNLTTITGNYTFKTVVTGATGVIDLPSLTTITGNNTFAEARTGIIDLHSLTTITGSATFSSICTRVINLSSLISITGNTTFRVLESYTSTLTLLLRTNLKISKPSGDDNFYFCCENTSPSDITLNLLYSTEDGTSDGTPMTGVTLNLATEPTSGTPGQWRMNATGSKFLTKLKTITLKPAEEEMTMPDEFTVKGAQNSSGGTISILFKKSGASAGVEWDETSQTYTWRRP
jgi:hypothetical protein